MIYAPVLSSQEQYRLDANIHRGAKRMLESLKFLPGDDKVASLEALESYRLFHRYYLAFRHIDDWDIWPTFWVGYRCGCDWREP
jgi:hypothetical protein